MTRPTLLFLSLAAVAALVLPRDANAAGRARVVTLDGATTEIVAALGAADELVGRDDSSYYPASVQTLPSIGYQFAVSAEGVLSLHPTLVIGRASAKPQSALDQIRAADVPLTLLPDAPTIADAQRKIAIVARVLHRVARGNALIAAMNRNVASLRARIAARRGQPEVRALMLLSVSPQTVLACGPNSGPGAMLQLAGARNALPTMNGCKPATTEAVLAADPDAIVTLSRDADAGAARAALADIPGVAQTRAARSHREYVFDGLYIGGFGPRTGRALLALFDALYAAR